MFFLFFFVGLTVRLVVELKLNGNIVVGFLVASGGGVWRKV
jgi:hypothetical protein